MYQVAIILHLMEISNAVMKLSSDPRIELQPARDGIVEMLQGFMYFAKSMDVLIKNLLQLDFKKAETKGPRGVPVGQRSQGSARGHVQHCRLASFIFAEIKTLTKSL